MAAPSDFVHLHVHSEYSLLDGANRVDDLAKYVKQLGQPAVALTDHGVLFGALEFTDACEKAGVKPIVGCEVYITPGSRTATGPREQKNTHHLLLLAQDFEGYRNLMRLSSIGHIEGYYYKPRIDFETLSRHTGGLVATSSCLSGLIPRALVARDDKKASEYLGKFVDMFGPERFFIELQDHGIPEQHTANAGLLKLAAAHNLKLIASNDAHYLKREDAEMHDVLLCIQTGCLVSDKSRMKFDTQEFYIKSTEEMAHLFRHVPESITNTRIVEEMCNLRMPKKEYHLPKFACPDGLSEDDYLDRLVWQGANRRYRGREVSDAALKDRIAFELSVIRKMGFAGYFLIVSDFIAHARSQGIPVGPGRGSAAGSVVAYALQITQLDPLEHNLLFERFLNPDRVSMPDIDIDFCFERRGEVIEYVRKKYGEDCVSSIITFGTMKAKAAIRDVGRVMGLEPKEVDKLAKLVPEGLAVTLESAIKDSQDLRAAVEGDPRNRRIYDYASRIEGMVRHASTHAAGIVIADRSIVEYAPLYKTPKEEMPATQFDMNRVESIGLLKMDFLGLKNLTIINRVEKWLKEREGIAIDWDALEFKDAKTYATLQKGHTAGVFQLESGGMTALVKALKPSEFADLTALLALYRPGPLDAGMDKMYVERKHGRAKVEYDHPTMEPILRESYGIFLYQEQVMRVAMEMCGFTRGEADVLRKAMGKKQADVMAKMEAKFVEGAKKTHDVDPALSKHIWEQILKFAGYGFNKSHSAAYAVLTFQTAYLRANYPAFFMAALMTNEIGGDTDTIARYVSNAREIGLQVLPADVNKSLAYFNPDGERIWYALSAVKTVGSNLVDAVVAERNANGPFKTFQDFMLRVPAEAMNSRQIEALVKVGAFDSLHKNRAALMQALPELAEAGKTAQEDRDSAQSSLFESMGESQPSTEVALPKVADWDQKARANYEKEFLGFYLSEHPLNRFAVEMESFAHTRSSQLGDIAEELAGDDTREITMFGVVTGVVTRTDKGGRPWGIVTLEDFEGSVEVKFFAKSFQTNRDLLETDRVLQIRGRLGKWNNRPSFDAWEARPAEELREKASGVELAVDAASLSEDMLRSLKQLCQRLPGKRALRLRLLHEHAGETVINLNGDLKVPMTDEVLRDLANLPGRPKVRLIVG